MRRRIYFTFYKMHNTLCNRPATIWCDNVALFTTGLDSRRGCFVNLLCSYRGILPDYQPTTKKMIMPLSFKVS